MNIYENDEDCASYDPNTQLKEFMKMAIRNFLNSPIWIRENAPERSSQIVCNIAGTFDRNYQIHQDFCRWKTEEVFL